jgi:hypothetical protein
VVVGDTEYHMSFSTKLGNKIVCQQLSFFLSNLISCYLFLMKE